LRVLQHGIATLEFEVAALDASTATTQSQDIICSQEGSLARQAAINVKAGYSAREFRFRNINS
jgi:hypothetical protein